jgi:histidine triad (HIT) family protein
MIVGNEGCIICKLVNGQLPISKIYEDDRVIGAMDIQPVNTGHLLIFPKNHAARLADLHPETGAHMFKMAMKVSEALRASGVRCEGVNLLLADGEAAGQEIFHVHLHVIPRFEGDGFGFRFDESYFVLPEREELDETASEIRDALLETNRE